MTASGESAASERVWQQVTAGPRRALEDGLSPADLRTLLLGVTGRRAAAVSPARLMSQWQQDRYVRLAASDPRLVWPLEARLWALLPGDFTGVDLSPVAPLGICSAIAPVSQDRVISTVRGSEVVSDPTNVLAVEAALRRRRSGAPVVHLASCHRVLRAQPFDGPGLLQHFRLFAMVSSARDRGSGTTEAALLTAHLRFWSAALSELLPGGRTRISYTVFGFPPLHERIRDTVLPALRPLPGGVIVEEDPHRQRARGYYERGAIRIDADADAGSDPDADADAGSDPDADAHADANTDGGGDPGASPGQEIGDGGFTNWTAQLLNDAKERCFISCLSTERLAALATPAG